MNNCNNISIIVPVFGHSEFVFDAVTPNLPKDWRRVERYSGEDGTLIRIRSGKDTNVPNRIIRK